MIRLTGTVGTGSRTNVLGGCGNLCGDNGGGDNGGGDDLFSDLSVNKDLGEPEDGTEKYIITAKNDGPDDEPNAIVTDLLPAGLTFVSATPSVGTYDPATGEWAIGALANGASETLEITVKVDPTALPITNTATITGDNKDENQENNESQYLLEGETLSSDLSITKEVDNPVTVSGAEITFTVTALNNGPSDEPNAIGIDILPAGLTFVSANSSLGTYDPVTGEWLIGALANGASETLEITVTVDTVDEITTITNTAFIIGDNEDADNSNNSDKTEVIVEPIEYALGITKTADKEEYDTQNGTIADTIVYTLTLSNTGNCPITNVLVTDTLPPNTNYVSSTNFDLAGFTDNGDGTWASTIGLQPGETTSATITIDTGTNQQSDLVNNVTVTSDEAEDAGAILIIPEEPCIGCIDIGYSDNNNLNAALTSSFGINVLQQGTDVVVNANDIVYINTNKGTSKLTNITICGVSCDLDIALPKAKPVAWAAAVIAELQAIGIPMEFGYLPYQVADNVYYRAFYIKSQCSACLDISFTYETEKGSIIQQQFGKKGSIKTCSDTSGLFDVTNFSCDPPLNSDLSIKKGVNLTDVKEGDEIVYTVVVTNNGPDDEANAVVTDLLPTGLTYTANTTSTGTYDPATGIWTVGALANGASETLTITANIDQGTAGTSILNKATVSGDNADSDGSNNDSEIEVTVGALSSDLSVKKGVDNLTPKEGEQVTFTINASNLGADNETNAVVNDLLPAGLVFVSASPTIGTYDSVTGDWIIGTLANGATETLTIIATVTAAAGEVITNIATIKGDNTDNNATNDSASVGVTVTEEPCCDFEVLDHLNGNAVVIGNELSCDGEYYISPKTCPTSGNTAVITSAVLDDQNGTILTATIGTGGTAVFDFTSTNAPEATYILTVSLEGCDDKQIKYSVVCPVTPVARVGSTEIDDNGVTQLTWELICDEDTNTSAPSGTTTVIELKNSNDGSVLETVSGPSGPASGFSSSGPTGQTFLDFVPQTDVIGDGNTIQFDIFAWLIANELNICAYDLDICVKITCEGQTSVNTDNCTTINYDPGATTTIASRNLSDPNNPVLTYSNGVVITFSSIWTFNAVGATAAEPNGIRIRNSGNGPGSNPIIMTISQAVPCLSMFFRDMDYFDTGTTYEYVENFSPNPFGFTPTNESAITNEYDLMCDSGAITGLQHSPPSSGNVDAASGWMHFNQGTTTISFDFVRAGNVTTNFGTMEMDCDCDEITDFVTC